MKKPSLASLARTDKQLQTQADLSGRALCEHRWTAVNVHGYGVREYAREVGIKQPTMSRSVKAWELLRDSESLSPSDVFERLWSSETRQIAQQAVADAHGTGLANARQRHMPEVRRDQSAIVNEPTTDARQARAQRYVEIRHREQRITAERKAQRAADPVSSLLDVEVEVDKARRALRQAVGLARNSHIDATWGEQLTDMLTECETLLSLLNQAVVDVSSIDWDTELKGLTE
jgi:hypothetical protein